jgi:hypothetical protein
LRIHTGDHRIASVCAANGRIHKALGIFFLVREKCPDFDIDSIPDRKLINHRRKKPHHQDAETENPPGCPVCR